MTTYFFIDCWPQRAETEEVVSGSSDISELCSDQAEGGVDGNLQVGLDKRGYRKLYCRCFEIAIIKRVTRNTLKSDEPVFLGIPH